MNRLPDIGKVSDLRLGDHPGFDAWFYSFCAENNIEHGINPSGVASPEQLRFMVALDERQVYAPCSDATFRELAASFHLRSFPPRVRSQYIAAWRSIIRVVRYEKDRQKRRDMINYCRHRFRGCLALGNILPSRLVKRLVTTLISHFDAGDPWLNERLFYNETLASFLRSQALQNALGRLPDGLSAEGIPDLRRALDLAELARLFHLAGRSHRPLTQLIHNCAAAESGKCGFPDIFTGSEAFIPQVEELFPGPPRTFLYICAMEGGLALDLRIIQTLLRLGHKVILTLKEAPVYYAPTIWDMDRDPLLVDSLPESHLFKAPAASKNELLRRLRENRLLIISDGTGERLNLYRTSVTFARAWKESDAVIARGRCNRDVLLGTSHLFTRDVFCFWEDRGEVRMQLKPHAPGIRKFSEQALTAKARTIIKSMRASKDSGKAVMFYSCIIGSIPGQTATAIKVADTFVRSLRERLDQVFIINPAEYFEPGMDGDDLMFMWEQVQRSGLINIWRFQSMEDIEASFGLMGLKVPPVWSGKDATFSTGCTKEMRIALDMQRSHPELQIVGPGPEKFFRRGDYGVGKFFDATISNAYQE